jgi:WD40 repeat protein
MAAAWPVSPRCVAHSRSSAAQDAPELHRQHHCRKGSVRALVVLEERQVFYNACWDVVQQWNIASGAVRLQLQLHGCSRPGDCVCRCCRCCPGSRATLARSVRCAARRMAAFSSRGAWTRRFASGRTLDGSVRRRRCAARLPLIDPPQPVRTLEGHSGAVEAVVTSSDGHFLFSVSTDRTVRQWNVESGELVRSLEGHTQKISRVAVSPTGHVVYSASEDGTVRQWTSDGGAVSFALAPRTAVPTVDWRCYGQLLRPTEGHSGPITVIVRSLDGKSIFSASKDRSVRRWDAATGQASRFASQQRNR